MKKQILGVLATLAVCLALSSVAFAAPCAKLSLSITPSTVSHGQTAMISGSVTNCSSSQETLKLDYTVTGPFGSKYAGYFLVTVQANETTSASFSYKVPNSLPPGTYTITVNAFDASSGAQLATTQAKVTVTL
jgi:hypothetical protein